ncbi:MAG: hypothetical protein SV186_04505 [Candidatus Nanohaloarchaea archaeon]|nr:hypothetical protein [Candidatus Nanohaloarchaea archaeon]
MQDDCAVCGKNLSKSGDPIVYQNDDEPKYVCSPGCGRTLRLVESLEQVVDALEREDTSD